MASKKLTLRQKEQLRATRSQLGRNPNVPLVSTPPGPGTDRLAQALAATQMGAGCGPVMADFFAKFTAEQKARRKKYNDISNQRKRDRGLLSPADRPAPNPPPKGQRAAGQRLSGQPWYLAYQDPGGHFYLAAGMGTFLLGPDAVRIHFGQGKMALVLTIHWICSMCSIPATRWKWAYRHGQLVRPRHR